MAYTTVQTGNSAPANVRESKSTNSKRLGTIANGTSVNVVRCDSTWATLLFNGTPAFIWNSLLVDPPTTNGAGLSTEDGLNTAKCNGSSVNVRASAVNGSVVDSLNKGDDVTISGLTNGSDGYVWYNIGSNRWVRGDYLTPGGSGSSGSSGGSDNSGAADDISVGDTVITILPAVNFRSTPGGTSLFQVSTGTTMVVTAITTSDGYTWYKGVISNSTGYLRGDCIEKYEGASGSNNSYTVGRYGATNTGGVIARKVAGGEKYSTNRYLREGSTFLITGTTVVGSDTWVKVRYGTASGQSTDAYISAQYFDELSDAPPNTAKERCIDIASSLNGVHETVLGLNGNCCQQFIYWLCGACGKVVNDMPYGRDLCGDARDYFKNPEKGSWHPLGDNYVPQAGDLVYYTSSTPGASSHVGLVIDNGSNSFATTGYLSIECNLSDTVKLCKGNYLTGTCDNDKTVQGFATPLWT